jgi:hypothetical protein
VACECGCGWQGEDEVTQWLVEEAARMKALKVQRDQTRSPEQEQADELMSRHADMLALRGSLGPR